MSYGYMIFSKTPSILLAKRRGFNFHPLSDRGHYKVCSRLHEGIRGLIDREGDTNTISNEGGALLLDIYAEIGQFFFTYFLLRHHEGEEDMAKKIHYAIESGKYVRCDLAKAARIDVNVPYLMHMGSK